jgi:hypothetical protein
MTLDLKTRGVPGLVLISATVLLAAELAIRRRLRVHSQGTSKRG